MNCPFGFDQQNAPDSDERFDPPYPAPLKKKSAGLRRLLKGWHSWIQMQYERSYRMKLGHVHMLGQHIYIPNELSLVRRVMVDEYEQFPKHEQLHRILEPLLGDSVFSTNGEVWKKQRRMMDAVFAITKLRHAFPLMQGAVDDLVQRLDQLPPGKDIVIDHEMTHVTADVIFRAILSQPLQADHAQTIYEAFIRYQDKAHKVMMLENFHLPRWWHWRDCKRSARTIRQLLADLIGERYRAFQASGEDTHHDMLSALMQAQDPESGERFDYTGLVDQISIMFLAGHETSASALTWSLYLLAKCPQLQQRMLDEYQEVIGEREPDFRDLHRLSTTLNLFNEALRLYPPVGFFMRVASHDTCMRDKQIKAGSTVMVSPWLLHRHRELWQQPDTFDPDRFARKDDPEAIRNAFMPFGAGPRICIGKAFAIQEAVLVLATLVRRYHIEPGSGPEPMPAGRVTIRPEHGVSLRLRRRAAEH